MFTLISFLCSPPFLQNAAGGAAAAPAASVAPTDALAHPMDVLSRIGAWAESFAPSLIGALLTLILGVWIAKLVTRGIRVLLVRGKVDDTLAKFLANIAYYTLFALVAISALGKLGVETASFIAIIGAAGLAVGFALQGSLGNLASGVMLMLFRPIRVGDLVTVAGQTGVVQEIGVFASTLDTLDNIRIFVPNSAITAGCIVNLTVNSKRRVDLFFDIGHDADLAATKKLIVETVSADPRVLKDPEIGIGVASLAAESIKLSVRPWCKPSDVIALTADLTERVKLALARAKVPGPMPAQKVFVHGSLAG